MTARTMTISMGKRAVVLPLCECGDVVIGHRVGARCRNEACQRVYADADVVAALIGETNLESSIGAQS